VSPAHDTVIATLTLRSNVSAEIFVVCQDFLAPKFIDPKFLDPKHVFKELAQNTAALPQSILSNGDSDKPRLTNPGMSLAIQGQATNVFAPEKKKRQREGYAEGDYTLYRSINVRDFINSPTIDDAMRVLSTCNAMTFDLSDSAPDAEKQKAWAASRHTTDDVKRDLEDLKVLGKGDFKKLMKWRLSIRLEVGLEVRKKDEEDATDKVEIEEDVDEEQVVTEEVSLEAGVSDSS
jgi:AdoMet-dependent rRNA methyltransferase SPB1